MPLSDVSNLLGDSSDPETMRFKTSHLIAVSSQETNKTTLDPSPKREWEKMLIAYLKGFTLIRSESMGGLYLAIFGRSDLMHVVHGLDAGKVATGVGNVLPNKGTIAVSLSFDNQSILFVASHFAGMCLYCVCNILDYVLIC